MDQEQNQDDSLRSIAQGEGMTVVEKEFERKVRPDNFSDFVGQHKVVDNLKIFVEAAKKRNEALDHVLLHGPPGLGKTTLAHIISNDLGVNIRVTSGPVLDKPGDLAGFADLLQLLDRAHAELFVKRFDFFRAQAGNFQESQKAGRQ